MVKVHSERESAGSNKCKREKKEKKLREKSCCTRATSAVLEKCIARSACPERERERRVESGREIKMDGRMREREAPCEGEKEIQNTSCNSHFPGSRAKFGRGFFIPRGRDRTRGFRQSDLLSSTLACTYLAGKVYRHVKKRRG